MNKYYLPPPTPIDMLQVGGWIFSKSEIKIDQLTGSAQIYDAFAAGKTAAAPL